MTESFLDERVTLHPGDCLDVLARHEECSIDSCVTDPPYHLTSIVKRFGGNGAAPAQFGTDGAYARASAGFMGKQWDGGDIAFRVETWAAVYRVLKPGAHLLAFSGTRTYHRMVCAIEDAGFEIRDCIQWLYGSGFPKSHDVSKGIDKRKDWAALQQIQRVIKQARTKGGKTLKQVGTECGEEWWYRGGYLFFETGMTVPTAEQWRKLKLCLAISDDWDEAFEAAEREVVQFRSMVQGGGNSLQMRVGERREVNADITAPATDAARQWEGWGTALKPACEIITLARKPLSEPTIAANVLRWGTGAINVGACRIKGQAKSFGNGTARSAGIMGASEERGAWESSASGRWPANIIHDGSEEVVGAFPETAQSTIGIRDPNGTMGYHGGASGLPGVLSGHADSGGSAARFFYQAQSDQKEVVTITWISDREPHQATLLVDTGRLLARGIVALGSNTNPEWSMFLSGSTITDLFRLASSCTIRTETNSTTQLQIWSWLTTLLTNEFTGAVNYETAIGGSLAESVGNGIGQIIITLGATVYLPGASLATSGTQLKISVSADQIGPQNSAGRFWYGSKADANDRLGALHPTVKPLDLMQYLVRLVTPPGGTILDLFAGTGTTGEAAWREGMRAVLIEREAEYQADIRRRMALVLAGPDERVRESVKARDKPVDYGPLFDTYNATDDFAKSIDLAYETIRERKAAGGPGWVQKVKEEQS